MFYYNELVEYRRHCVFIFPATSALFSPYHISDSSKWSADNQDICDTKASAQHVTSLIHGLRSS